MRSVLLLACLLCACLSPPATAQTQQILIVPLECQPPPLPLLCLPTFFFSQIGVPVPVRVAAVDAGGRLDPNYRGTVTITSEDAYATLPAPYTFTAADGGLHTFHVTFATRTTRQGPFANIYATRVTATDDAGRTSSNHYLLPGSAPLVPPVAVPSAGSGELVLLGLLFALAGAGALRRTA